jgi:hypothetical protein
MSEFNKQPIHLPNPDLKTLGYNTENAQEAGYPAPRPRRGPLKLPPGGGKALVPHFVSFANIVNMFTRTYRYTFDEAQKHSRQYTLAIRNEPIVMDAARSLQIPACMLSWHIEPEDIEDPFEQVNAEGLQRIVKKIPRFQQYRRCLLEGCFYGRYGVQNFLQYDFAHGQQITKVRDWLPVNGDKLIFRYNGQVGILVHATWNERATAITDRGRAYFLSPEEREALVVHEFEPEDSDFYEGDTAGAIHGVGWRGRIYWLYWLRAQVLGWLMEYLERVGAGGLTIYYYEAGNPASMQEVKSAAENQLGNNCLLFPRYKNSKGLGPGIERVDPSNSGAILIRDLVMNYFDGTIRHYIQGETLTSQAEPTGLGTGAADAHGSTKGERIKYIAADLDETLSQQLLGTLNRLNCPDNPCPRFVSEVDKPNVGEFMQGVSDFVNLGGQVDESKLRQTLALPGPIPGQPTLGLMPPAMPPGPGGNEEGPPPPQSKKQRAFGRKLRRQLDANRRRFGLPTHG